MLILLLASEHSFGQRL